MGLEEGCIFCAIVAGEAPAHKVYEDDKVVVFMDLFPVADGHTLIVTKDHGDNIYETDGEVLAAVGRASRKVADAIRSVFEPDGLGVFQLNGAAAGQTVFHYHMHLIPCAEGHQLSIHSRKRETDERLAQVAEELRLAMSAGS